MIAARGLGWVRDPAKQPHEKPDWESHRLLGAAPPPPASASNAAHILSVLTQGEYKSCVANVAMQLIRAWHSFRGVPNAPLGSRWWAYFFARLSYGGERVDEGTYLRAAFEALARFGFPLESEWPYASERNGRPMYLCHPTARANMAAADQRAPLGYYRITGTGEARVLEVKRAIASGHCVGFGTLVTEAFVRGDCADTFLGVPRPGEPIAGPHALTLAAFDERGFSGPNSWGDEWGDAGWFHFKPEVIAWAESDDFWIVRHVPKFFEPVGAP